MTNHPNRSTKRLTIKSLREVAESNGVAYARFVAEQEATQRGRANMQPVFDELERLERAHYGS